VKPIIVLGNCAFDHVFEVPQLPVRGNKVTATVYRQSGGGIAATAAVAISAMGGNAHFWGRLGNDPVGDLLAAEMANRGVDISNVRRVEGAVSAVACVIVDADGERQIATFPGAGMDDDPSWLPLEHVKAAGAVMIDFRWVAGAERLAAAARQARIPVVLDVDLGAVQSVERLLAIADYAIFSAPALLAITGCQDTVEALRSALPRVGGTVGVTTGPDGFRWLDAKGEPQHEPGYDVQVKDTTGAGDVFHGSFALGLADGKTVREASRFANAAAAVKCRNGGGWSGMANRATVHTLMSSLT
jgi:sulfofructose kinase